MRTEIALIADVHGNLPALEAVLCDIDARGIDRVFFLGDAVGKGPQSAEAVDVIFQRCERVVRGNWEDAVLDGWIGTAPYYRETLGDERLRKLRDLPLGIFMTLSGRTVKLFHGRTTIDQVVFSSSPKEEILKVINAMGDSSDVVGFADVHQPFVRMCETHMLFNIGSVGNPCDGIPQSSYAILRGSDDSETVAPLSLELVRLPYDRERSIQAAMDAPDLPGRDLYIQEVRTGLYQRKKVTL
jgi:protein phosphatase